MHSSEVVRESVISVVLSCELRYEVPGQTAQFSIFDISVMYVGNVIVRKLTLQSNGKMQFR
jgi:hypothetical protein